MKHYGDITQLSGYDLPVVDVIVGGSPCQDLSVAGARKGLDGDRSSLFMEQIRIIKEMREQDGRTGRSDFLVRPRFMVWENVPGAFSSNGGKDFQTVLEEIVKIVEPDVPDLRTAVCGTWTKSGCLYSSLGRWSIAWRVHDAQFWGATQYLDGRIWIRGTPQRRKRIALVADFGGLCAPEILFVREGMSRNPEQGEKAWQRTSGRTEGSTDPAIPIEGNGSRESHKGNGYGESGDPSFTLNSVEQHGVMTAYGIGSYESNAMKSSNPHSGIYKADTARTLDLNGGSPACNQGGMAVVEKCMNSWDVQSKHIQPEDGVAETLYAGECRYGGGESYVMAVDCRNGTENECTNGTLQAKSNGGFNTNSNNIVRISS